MGGQKLTTDGTTGILRGTTLEMYRFLLKTNKPVGLRQVQRALKLSSPSVAAYHLAKLEDAGLVKREQGDYTVSKLILDHSVRVNRFIIPKHIFYATFAAIVLLIELTVFRPSIINREYFFSTITTLVFVIVFSYEATKALHRREL